jgi:hypothetical protein
LKIQVCEGQNRPNGKFIYEERSYSVHLSNSICVVSSEPVGRMAVYGAVGSSVNYLLQSLRVLVWGQHGRRAASCRSLRTQVMPNPSVNLTRNSVPHLPGSARYAHNALPGKRVTLPRAGYLKR